MSRPTSPTPTGRSIRIEGIVQVVIMLAIGGAAGAASFTHVHNVASAHGQGGWLAWADAVVLELMSLAGGLELRHHKRHGKPVWVPATILVVAVVLSLSAQVVEAEQSFIGWIAAALPAAGFLAMVKIALGHSAPRNSTEPDPASGTDHGLDDADQRTVRRPRQRTKTADRTARTDRAVLDAAAQVAHAKLTELGLALTRQALTAQLREAGHTVSNERAGELVKRLRSVPEQSSEASEPVGLSGSN